MAGIGEADGAGLGAAGRLHGGGGGGGHPAQGLRGDALPAQPRPVQGHVSRDMCSAHQSVFKIFKEYLVKEGA